MHSKFICGFSSHAVPRIDGENFDVSAFDSLLRHRAFVHGAILGLVQERGLSVEVSLACIDAALGVDILFRVWNFGTNPAGPEVVPEVAAMLSADYQWKLMEAPTAESFGVHGMRVARIVRRLDYVDLPMVDPSLLRRANVSSATTESTSAATKPAGSFDFGISLPAPRLHRELPRPTASLHELHARRLCLPLPGTAEEVKPRQRLLLEQLLRSAPACVTTMVHPASVAFLSQTRQVADAWRRFLEVTSSQLSLSGLASSESLLHSYAKFGLPEATLCQISLRAGAPSNDRASRLAEVMASMMGGRGAFHVRRPTRDVPWESLVDPHLDFPQADAGGDGPMERTAVRVLKQSNVSEPQDRSVLTFLAGLPHIFSREESLAMLSLPIADQEGLPGLDSVPIAPFARPSLSLEPISPPKPGHLEGDIRIGLVEHAGFRATPSAARADEDRYGWRTMPKNNLTKHALIVGSTGSGKTLTTSFLLLELARIGVPFMVVEPVKTEYYDRLKGRIPNLSRRRFEGDADGKTLPDYLRFDPMRVPQGVTVARHAALVKSCFEAAFPLDPLLSLVLDNGIREYYLAPTANGGCGLQLLSRGGSSICRIEGGAVFPSYATFRDYFIHRYIPKAFPDAATKGGKPAVDVQKLFERRFDSLSSGLLGESFRLADEYARVSPEKYYDLLQGALTRNVIVELDAIADGEQKALMMAFLLTYLFEYRQSEDFAARRGGKTPPLDLRHVLIVEEAHRLLAAGLTGKSKGGELAGVDPRTKAVQLFVDMLAEIRAFGQGIVIVEQIPTKIVLDAVKNTNLKVMLRLTAKDDRDYLGEAMNFNEAQKRFVSSLAARKGAGISFVAFEEGNDLPVLSHLPLPAEPRGDWLFDEHFANVTPTVGAR
jgi:hypothetical protein